MITTPEKLSLAHKTALDTSLTTVRTLFDSSERLIALNFNTARALLESTTASTRAVLGAKRIDELSTLQAAQVQPAIEAALAYFSNVYNILTQGLEEAVKPLEAQFAVANKFVANELEKAAQAAPVGSEVVVAALKSGIAAANTTYDHVSKTTRQVAELAESNVAAVTDVAVKAVGGTASRRKKTV